MIEMMSEKEWVYLHLQEIVEGKLELTDLQICITGKELQQLLKDAYTLEANKGFVLTNKEN